MERRAFIESILGSVAALSVGGLSSLYAPTAHSMSPAGFSPITRRTLINTLLDGGPDMRHLIVPKPNSTPGSYGFEYWSNRSRSHLINNEFSAWMTRFNDDYYPITVGGQNWNSSIVDQGAINTSVSFGVWREAGWLLDQFLNGNVALVFNIAGSTIRNHERALNQSSSGFSQFDSEGDISGWGGRLSRRSNNNVLSVTDAPNHFSFGPSGTPTNFNPFSIDNSRLVSIPNFRQYGLNEFGPPTDRANVNHSRVARALNRYYDNFRTQTVRQPFEVYQNHEATLRSFGDLLEVKLDTVELPDVMVALRDSISINGQPVNPDDNGRPRRVVNNVNFAQQIISTYDALASNDIVDSSVISLQLTGFDSHSRQRGSAINRNGVITEGPELDALRVSLNAPTGQRGLEGLFKDLFGGPFVDEPNALHSSFSALQTALTQANVPGRDKLVFTFWGEFGRQLRDNGDNGTDHGDGNLMIVVGDKVRGGIYGNMFPDAEISRYTNNSLNTPDIQTLTHSEHLFAAIADWITPNSSSSIFPWLSQSGEDAPILESGVSFSQLFS